MGQSVQDPGGNTQDPLFSKTLLENFFSYLFHELMSPLSSLLTGLDLLEDGTHNPELLEILQNSVRTLRGRLEFFRAALGAGGSSLSLSQTQKILGHFWGEHSKAPVIVAVDVDVLPHGVGKQLLLLALWASHKRPFGAKPARVHYAKDLFFVEINGETWDEGMIQDSLSRFPDALTPQQSIDPLIRCLL